MRRQGRQTPINSQENWPSLENVKDAQESLEPNETGFVLYAVVLRKEDSIRFPDSTMDIKFRLLATAHGGSNGHSGLEATVSILLEKVSWSGMEKDVRELIRFSLHCLLSRFGAKVQRPMAHA